jgi:hypothetical protein
MNVLYLVIHFAGGQKALLPVESVESAALKFRSFIETNGYGASHMRGNCGNVTEIDSRKVVAKVNYNGTVVMR